MNEQFDAIVIGSGFGGAVTSCRLSQHGYKVLVLERGKRWNPDNFPRDLGDDWIWDQYNPAKRHGWIDLRLFPKIGVAQGAGVGGGSLIYANILIDAERDIFDNGWPAEIDYDVLAPHYKTVSEMLGAQQVPLNQWTERTRLMQEGATAIGQGDRFKRLDLAVTFDPEWNYDLPDPFDVKHAKPFVNAHGVEQATCIHLGNCDIGCDVKARNTLDLNYLAVAEQQGAEIRPLHLVHHIEQQGDGYRVHFDQITDDGMNRGSASARIVILAAGSLGSTEMLLRCRDQFKTLPLVSKRLGIGWSSNGDFLTPAIHSGRNVAPTRGPTITSAIDFLDGSQDGQEFLIEDGGFPDVLRNWIYEVTKGNSLSLKKRALKRTFQETLGSNSPINNVMPWFAQGRDAADGELKIRRRWWFFGAKRLYLDWDIDRSKPVVDAIISMHERLARSTGGVPLVPPTWTLAKYLITPHPLGGCNMGPDAARGVVDHKGEVFGYRNLFVADGAIVPEAIGSNPSKTIAALAERIAGGIIESHR